VREKASSDPESAWLDLLLLVPLGVALMPLLLGFPQGHDWSFELIRIAEFGHALADGPVPPAWAGNLYGGYGSPIFLFYAPLYAGLASAFGFIWGSIPGGAVLALVASAAVGVFAMRRAALLATGGSRAAARVAVAVYLLHPYLLCDLLLRNANAEFAALCLAPLVLVGLLALPRRPRAGMLWLSGGVALVILAHNLTALWVVGLLLAAGLVLYPPHQERRTWLRLGAALVLGLGIAAFFWMPAVGLSSLVHTDQLLTGKFDFHRQFPPFLSLFGYERFYAAGVLPPALLACGLYVAVVSRGGALGVRRLLGAAIAGSALLVFLMLPASTWLWERVPWLPFFQFPWRMQGPLALLCALIAALVFAELSPRLGRSARYGLELALLLAVIVNALPHLSDARPLEERQALWAETSLDPEALQRGSNVATVRDDYLPHTASPRLWRTRRPDDRGILVLDSRPGSTCVSTHPKPRRSSSAAGSSRAGRSASTGGRTRSQPTRWVPSGPTCHRGRARSSFATDLRCSDERVWC